MTLHSSQSRGGQPITTNTSAPARPSAKSRIATPLDGPSGKDSAQAGDLLLRETIHRTANDLQLVVSLLALQSRRAECPETRQALADATERVAVLARARTALQQQRQETLAGALQRVCEALHSPAEPRSILL